MNHDDIMKYLRRQHGDKLGEFLIPPPVFNTMQGEFVDFDPESATLLTRFPVLEKFFNPYRGMQGGMIAAAVDNNLGPLSMLVAPPNLTRRLEVKYSRPVTAAVEYILVRGKLVQQDGSRLTFSAEVRDPEGNLLARARATHWIVAEI